MKIFHAFRCNGSRPYKTELRDYLALLRGDPEMIDITPDGERGVIQDELADLNTLELKN
jgi:hypothetical protein